MKESIFIGFILLISGPYLHGMLMPYSKDSSMEELTGLARKSQTISEFVSKIEKPPCNDHCRSFTLAGRVGNMLEILSLIENYPKLLDRINLLLIDAEDYMLTYSRHLSKYPMPRQLIITDSNRAGKVPFMKKQDKKLTTLKDILLKKINS